MTVEAMIPTAGIPETTDESGTDHPTTLDSLNDPENEDQGQDDTNPNSEAARWRRKLRDAEGELTTVRGLVETLQRKDVERIASLRLSVGSDVFEVGGVQLSDVLTPDGSVDEDVLNAAIDTLLEQRPGLNKNSRPGPSHSDYGQARSGGPTGRRKAQWSDVIHRPGGIVPGF